MKRKRKPTNWLYLSHNEFYSHWTVRSALVHKICFFFFVGCDETPKISGSLKDRPKNLAKFFVERISEIGDKLKCYRFVCVRFSNIYDFHLFVLKCFGI